MIQVPRRVVAFFALAAIVGFAGNASAQDKFDRALREGRGAGKTHRVIITTEAGYEPWVREMLTRAGKSIEAELPSVNGLAVELTDAELDTVCPSGIVRGCHSNPTVSPTASRRKPSSGSTTTSVNTVLGTLGLKPVAAGGYGVTVALIDSGIYPSPSFGRRIKAFYDFTRGGIRTRPYDDYGHGTHVAGLIGGLQSSADVQYQGVAPSVQFVGLKVLNRKGQGKTSDVIRAIEFAIANKGTFGIDIINLSLGHPIFEPASSDPLVQAVERAVRAGIIVVTSAGNYGMNADGELGFAGTTSPGNAPSALTSGAADHQDSVTRADDRTAPYSSSGPTWYDAFVKPDFLAPGHLLSSEASPSGSLYNSYPDLVQTGPSGKKFLQLSGTSMAAGVTTGVVALMKQAMPYLTPNLAKGVLQYTAIALHDDAGAAYNPLRQGTGGINAAGALQLLGRIDPAITDLETPWASGPESTSIGGTKYSWAQNIVWGDNIVQQKDATNALFDDDNIVWGNLHDDNIVWGNNDDNIVWGFDDNIVWGDAAALSLAKGGR